jgi:hypothetical protein
MRFGRRQTARSDVHRKQIGNRGREAILLNLNGVIPTGKGETANSREMGPQAKIRADSRATRLPMLPLQ